MNAPIAAPPSPPAALPPDALTTIANEFARALFQAFSGMMNLQGAASIPAAAGPSLAEAIEQLLAAKLSANCRPSYVTSLRQYLGLFARGREQRAVNTFTTAEIEAWFSHRKEAPGGQRSNLGRLSALFSFCHRRGYVAVNPCCLVERVRVESVAPVILSPGEARRLLNLCRQVKPCFLAQVTLGLFAGIRPVELTRLQWAAVDLKRGMVKIDAGVAKVRQMRWVPLSANAVAWLHLAPNQSGHVTPPKATLRRARRRLVKEMAWAKGWPQDLLRHTAASYLLAREQDAAKVSLGLGNSPGILLKHYRELVTPEEAEQFWNLRPDNVAEFATATATVTPAVTHQAEPLREAA